MTGMKKTGFIQHHSNSAGFTLMEILVAATIVAVLSVIGVVSYASVNKRSRDAKRKSDLEQVRSALEMYRADNSVYPGLAEGFIALTSLDTGDGSGPLVPTYLPAIPMDPKSSVDTPVTYFYSPLKIGTGTKFYNYCVCGFLESETVSSTCGTSVTLPPACNYGLKNP